MNQNVLAVANRYYTLRRRQSRVIDCMSEVNAFCTIAEAISQQALRQSLYDEVCVMGKSSPCFVSIVHAGSQLPYKFTQSYELRSYEMTDDYADHAIVNEAFRLVEHMTEYEMFRLVTDEGSPWYTQHHEENHKFYEPLRVELLRAWPLT